MSKKSLYWQQIRTFCILAVIMIHCPNGTNLNQDSLQFWLYIILRSVVNFPVAVFFFMAGYFINRDKVKNNCTFFLLNRGVRLIIPYLIWSLVYESLSIVRGNSIDLFTIVKHLLIGKAASPFYYIVVLVQLTLLTPLLIKINGKYKQIRGFWHDSGYLCRLS